MKICMDKFENWLKSKNLKETTIQNYLYCFMKFTYPHFNQESVSMFLSNKTHRDSNGRAFLTNLQKFLRVNYKELGLTDEKRIQISEVELPEQTGRQKKRLIKIIPHEQIPLLEKALETEQLKIQLLLTYYCALRLGELLKIEIMSFNWEEWAKDQEKMGECRVYGKGDKEGIALVPSILMKRIAKFIRNKKHSSVNSKLFIRYQKKRINLKNKACAWQNRLREAGVKAGITKLDAEGKRIPETVVHPHKLRHSYATYLLNVKKLDIRYVQELLRHASIQSTQIYTHVDKEDLKNALSEKLNKEEIKNNSHQDYSACQSDSSSSEPSPYSSSSPSSPSPDSSPSSDASSSSDSPSEPNNAV